MLKKLLALFGKKSAPAFEMPSESRLKSLTSGLKYEILAPGAGKPPTATSTVTVRYAGWLTSGQLFDASYPGKSSFPLSRVIPGWTEGLQLIAPGGTVRLVVPPLLAYGSAGSPPRIGPNETLVFHVELLSVR